MFSHHVYTHLQVHRYARTEPERDYLVSFPLVSTSALFTWKLDKGFKVWSVFKKNKIKLLKVSRSTSMHP